MKNILPGLLLCLLVTPGSRCTHDWTVPAYTGKLVFSGNCHTYVVQVLSTVDPARITDSWTDSTTGHVYNQVFQIQDHCTWGGILAVAVADTFHFTFTELRAETCDCVQDLPNLTKNPIQYLGK